MECLIQPPMPRAVLVYLQLKLCATVNMLEGKLCLLSGCIHVREAGVLSIKHEPRDLNGRAEMFDPMLRGRERLKKKNENEHQGKTRDREIKRRA